MFPQHYFGFIVTDDIKATCKESFDIDIRTDIAVFLYQEGCDTSYIIISTDSLKESLSHLVHECSHMATEFMEVIPIDDDEFRSYFTSFIFTECVKLLEKWEVPYKVVQD